MVGGWWWWMVVVDGGGGGGEFEQIGTHLGTSSAWVSRRWACCLACLASACAPPHTRTEIEQPGRERKRERVVRGGDHRCEGRGREAGVSACEVGMHSLHSLPTAFKCTETRLPGSAPSTNCWTIEWRHLPSKPRAWTPSPGCHRPDTPTEAQGGQSMRSSSGDD